MKGLKGLIGVFIGLTCVIVTLGVSSLFVKDTGAIYNMKGGEFLLSPLGMSIGWIISSGVLVILFSMQFILGFTKKKIILFSVFFALHIIGVIALFLVKNLTFSFLIICIILMLYLRVISGLKGRYPKFFILFWLNFLWICMILAQNYLLLIFN